MDGMRHFLVCMQSWLNGVKASSGRDVVFEKMYSNRPTTHYPTQNTPYSIMKASNENQLELTGMNKIARIKNDEKLKQWAKMVRCRNESGISS